MDKYKLLEILKIYYSQGDDYYCGELEDFYYAGYSNDYPLQHGYGIEIRLYKVSNKIRVYKNDYRYKRIESELNLILKNYVERM